MLLRFKATFEYEILFEDKISIDDATDIIKNGLKLRCKCENMIDYPIRSMEHNLLPNIIIYKK